MGGNSKITLELVRWLSQKRPCIVVTTQPLTFQQNGVVGEGIAIEVVPPYSRNPYLHHVDMCRYYCRWVRAIFGAYQVGPSDVVYCTSDALGEVLPGYLLKPQLGFTWMPSLYLFIPTPYANLSRRYGFPFVKYALYYVYQRLIFLLIRARGDRFIITNDADRSEFPPDRQSDILAIYGGVNCEQILAAEDATTDQEKTYDVLFCSRLHPQKGIGQLLDAWKIVRARIPTVRLGIIGNGAPDFEAFLRNKSKSLGLESSIDWLGYVNNIEKYLLYQKAKVFAHATVYDNNGMVAAEALCTGLPVVMYDIPSLRAVYSAGCLKVPNGRIDAYAEALVQLLADPSAYAALRPTENDVQALRQDWDWQKRASAFDAFAFPAPIEQHSDAVTETTETPARDTSCPPLLISVVRDYDMYNRCFSANTNALLCVCHAIDNRANNAPVPDLYNRFLEAYDYSQPSWLVFCHEDFELKGPLGVLLQNADKRALYGPIGACTTRKWLFRDAWCLVGQIEQSGKDGQGLSTIGSPAPINTPVETFDCLCLIVHSDLIKETGLRFDSALFFDLYVEDFCIQASERFGIQSLVLPLACRHWSPGAVGDRYLAQEQYLHNKYRNCCYTGTSSYYIGSPSLIRRLNARAVQLIRRLTRVTKPRTSSTT